MKNIDTRELISGVVLVGFGVFIALYASSHYEIGTVRRMGPGFFPTMLGWILAALGIVVTLMSFRKVEHALTPPPFELRPFLAVLLAVVTFAVLINRIGLILTTIILIVIAATANTKFRFSRALLLGGCVSILAWLIFTVGLQMNLPAFKFPE